MVPTPTLLRGVVQNLPGSVAGAALDPPVALTVADFQERPEERGIGRVPVRASSRVSGLGWITRVEPNATVGGRFVVMRGSAAQIAHEGECLTLRLHDLRHGFASALLLAGVNVKIVSEALGHSRTAFTMDVYANVLPGMGEQVASAIEAALADG